MDFDRCHDGGGLWYDQEQGGDRASNTPQASSDSFIYTYILVFERIVHIGIWKEGMSQFSF